MRHVLPAELREVSGLAWQKKDRMAMVQDETGRLYIYDLRKKKVRKDPKFGAKGDHEGVAFDGTAFYIVESKGVVHRYDTSENLPIVSWNTSLSANNDVEGACWDPGSGRLLMACKGDPGNGMDGKVQRAIWAFDPVKGVLDPEPFLLVPTAHIAEALRKCGQGTAGFRFAPSGIAVHPRTGDLWVLSAHHRALVVVGADGTIRDATLLDPALFLQPEGIAFSPSGDLFISSEGGDHKGYLLVFHPRHSE